MDLDALTDARRAECYSFHDRHMLLAIIEASFVDLESFSRVVRAIMAPEAAQTLPRGAPL